MGNKIIISLTSYPQRINGVYRVIGSLLKQTVKADNIFLWLSLLEFPDKEQNLPSELLNLVGTEGFRICWVNENLKSHKKYYYILQEHIKDIIITVDDDIYYSATMVEELLDAYCKFPNAILARNVRMILKKDNKIASYDLWDKNCKGDIQKERQDLCALGWGGILYPPYVAKKRWFDTVAIENLCLAQDDLWLKFNEVLDKIPVVYVEKKQEDIIIKDAQECALYKSNISENYNNISIDKLYRWGKERDNETIEKWIHGLSDSIIFYKQKKEKYALYIKGILQERRENIYICGAGKYAEVLIKLFKYINMSDVISGLIVSHYKDNPRVIEGIPVFSLEDVKINKNTLVICGVSSKNRRMLKPYFDKRLCEWLDLDIYMIARCFEILQERGV